MDVLVDIPDLAAISNPIAHDPVDVVYLSVEVTTYSQGIVTNSLVSTQEEVI